jgi:hypothetical protein
MIWTLKQVATRESPPHFASRCAYDDEITARFRISGITHVERDAQFDDDKMRSAGISLTYSPSKAGLEGIKYGILLKLGFNDTAPNRAVNVSF